MSERKTNVRTAVTMGIAVILIYQSKAPFLLYGCGPKLLTPVHLNTSRKDEDGCETFLVCHSDLCHKNEYDSNSQTDNAWKETCTFSICSKGICCGNYLDLPKLY